MRVSSVGRVYSAWPTVWWWSFIRLPGEPWPAVWWRPFGREVGFSRNTIQEFHETQASRLYSIPFHETKASRLNSIPFHEIQAARLNIPYRFTKYKHHDLIPYCFTKHIQKFYETHPEVSWNTSRSFTKHKHHNLIPYRFMKHNQKFHKTQALRLNSIPFHETHPPLIEAFWAWGRLVTKHIQTSFTKHKHDLIPFRFTKHKHHYIIPYRFTKHIPSHIGMIENTSALLLETFT